MAKAKQVVRVESLNPKTVEYVDFEDRRLHYALKHWNSKEWEALEKRCSFPKFVEEQYSSPVACGDKQVFAGKNNSTVTMDEGLLYVSAYNLSIAFGTYEADKAFPYGEFTGIWLEEHEAMLLDGDLQFTFSAGFDHPMPSCETLHSALGSINLEKNHPTISFNCLAQFYKDDHNLVLKKFKNKELVVLDFEFDESVPITKAQKEQIVAAKKKEKATGIAAPLKIKSPKLGYTLVGNKWHRPGAVLLHDKKENWFILVGQDEGTYFGVELQGSCSTINEALESLVPNEARGQKYVRQGEWFIVNVDPKIVPEEKDCLAAYDYNNGSSLYLPRETPDSNIHWVDSGDVRFTKDGKMYALNPTLSHDQHSDVDMKGWCTFYKNTAIRSYSQDGVD